MEKIIYLQIVKTPLGIPPLKIRRELVGLCLIDRSKKRAELKIPEGNKQLPKYLIKAKKIFGNKSINMWVIETNHFLKQLKKHSLLAYKWFCENWPKGEQIITFLPYGIKVIDSCFYVTSE